MRWPESGITMLQVMVGDDGVGSVTGSESTGEARSGKTNNRGQMREADASSCGHSE